MRKEDLQRVFSDSLRQARAAHGLSQAATAKEISIATEVYARLERGHMLPRTTTLVGMADALGISTDLLLGLIDDYDRMM